jgi:membrane AbrB-like protein
MSSSAELPRRSLHVVETFLIAAGGGVLFMLVGFPAGLIAGSVLAVAVAALMGRPVLVPPLLARITFVLVGISIGTVVTPETLKGIAAWPLSIAVLAVAVVCMILATTSYLRIVHRWDPQSALFGASPGALAQVMGLAAEYGADLRGIAIVQTVRVVMLTVGMPAALALFGLAASPNLVTGRTLSGSAAELALMIVVPTIVALALMWARFPGGLLFGAMLGSAVLYGGGFIQASPPGWLTSAGVVALGAVTGARFANTDLRMLLGYIGAAFGSFAVAAAVAGTFVLLLIHILPLRTADVIVAFAPGAQDTMTVLALALHLDPIYVGAHHLARFLLVSLSLPVLARHLARPDVAKRVKRRRRPTRPTIED